IGRIAVVVMCPVGDGTQRSAGGKYIGLIKQRHERDEAAIGTAVDTDVAGVDPIVVDQQPGAVYLVAEILTPHMAVNAGTVVAPIARTARIVDIEHRITEVGQQVMEQVFPEVLAPPIMYILQVAGP